MALRYLTRSIRPFQGSPSQQPWVRRRPTRRVALFARRSQGARLERAAANLRLRIKAWGPWLWGASPLQRLALVGLALLGLAGWGLTWLSSPASLVDARDVVWGRQACEVGDPLGRDWLELESGTIQVAFRSGALVAIHGPARFRAERANRGRLAFGSMGAHVPDKAHGFTMHAPGIVVTDLGTGFQLTVGRSGGSEVHVTSGRVRVRQLEDGASFELAAGMIAERSTTGELRTITTQDTAPVTSKSVTFLGEHVPSLGLGSYNHDDRAFLFLEAHQVVLPYDVAVNLQGPGKYQRFDRRQATLPAGARVSCYLLHCAPQRQRHVVSGELTFSQPILGVICVSDRLNATNDCLGASWSLQCQHPQRGLESIPDTNADTVTIGSNRRSVSFRLQTEGAIDQMRILVGDEYPPRASSP